jgi:hypothetical protein
MSAYETSATVGNHGDVHLLGVPFQPGTEVEVVINPRSADVASPSEARERLASLLSAPLDGAHNTEPVGSLNREELYDRNALR